MALLNTSTTFSAAPPYACDATTFAALCSLHKVAGSLTHGRKQLVVLSVTSLEHVRKPLLPRAGFLSKPTALVSERVICTDVQPGLKLELKYAKPPAKDFVEFMETMPKQEVVAFFRDIAAELEGFRQLQDFHMKVRDGDGDFRVEVFFNEERNGPDVAPYEDCIGCCPDTNLFVGQEPGMASKDCILEQFSLRPYAVCRLDAKGRTGFSIMPVRHVERMSELDDDELYGMWSVATRMLRQVGIPFISLILNHGRYRTLYHLNLKLWVGNKAHDKFLSTCNEETRELWNGLQKFAANRPKKQQLCFFYRRDGTCRHGDFCSYSHGEYRN
ncbi:hypothetical protein GOP47_0015444 [Adiantum capillus-veneris]|nr:hypothetical protein GOP47_0015444 [Adiantum capillus-veneris]